MLDPRQATRQSGHSAHLASSQGLFGKTLIPTIDKQIVQMEFDARKFRQGVKQSQEDLNSFKKSFDMKEVQDSLSSIEKATKMDFSIMADSLDSINSKLVLLVLLLLRLLQKSRILFSVGLKVWPMHCYSNR